MKVDIRLGVDGHRTNVLLTPEQYDGHPPLGSLNYFTRLRMLDPNISAVSLAILLQAYASESIVYHEGVQVHVAEAIENFLSTRRCRVTPVEQTPMAIVCGSRRARIGSDAVKVTGSVGFELGDISSFSSNASLGKVHIASNASGFFPNDECGNLKASIHAATFVAPDYAFAEISLSQRCAELLGNIEFSRYQDLLGSVNLKLTKES